MHKPLYMALETTRKLILLGDEDTVETEDLLAILLNSEKAAHSISEAFGTLGSIEEATSVDLMGLPHVGAKRASTLRAVLALARRRGIEPPFRGRQIKSSQDVCTVLNPIVRHERREILMVLPLDAKNRLTRSPIVAAIGSLTQAVIEPRELLRPLIVAAAASAILSHNHPSSCPEPSMEDITISQTMFEACALVGIHLLDHVIIGDGQFVSLADRGLL